MLPPSIGHYGPEEGGSKVHWNINNFYYNTVKYPEYSNMNIVFCSIMDILQGNEALPNIRTS